MKNLLLILIILLMPISVNGANVIQCDPNDIVVPNKVVRYMTSVDTGQFLIDPNDITKPLPNFLIHPEVPIAPRQYWKCENGEVVEMNQSEKDAIDLANQPLPPEPLKVAVICDENGNNCKDLSEGWATITKIDGQSGFIGIEALIAVLAGFLALIFGREKITKLLSRFKR